MIHTGIQMTPNNHILAERRGGAGGHKRRTCNGEEEEEEEQTVADARIYMRTASDVLTHTSARLRTYGTRHAGTTASRGADRLARRGSWRQPVGPPGSLLELLRYPSNLRPSLFFLSAALSRSHGRFVLSLARIGDAFQLFAASRFKFQTLERATIGLDIDPAILQVTTLRAAG